MSAQVTGERLAIEVRRTGTALFIALGGELDLGTRGQLDSLTRRCPRQDLVVFDLTRLTFIDSQGLCGLICALRRASRLGAHTSVLSPTADLPRRVLELVDPHVELPLARPNR